MFGTQSANRSLSIPGGFGSTTGSNTTSNNNNNATSSNLAFSTTNKSSSDNGISATGAPKSFSFNNASAGTLFGGNASTVDSSNSILGSKRSLTNSSTGNLLNHSTGLSNNTNLSGTAPLSLGSNLMNGTNNTISTSKESSGFQFGASTNPSTLNNGSTTSGITTFPSNSAINQPVFGNATNFNNNSHASGATFGAVSVPSVLLPSLTPSRKTEDKTPGRYHTMSKISKHNQPRHQFQKATLEAISNLEDTRDLFLNSNLSIPQNIITSSNFNKSQKSASNFKRLTIKKRKISREELRGKSTKSVPSSLSAKGNTADMTASFHKSSHFKRVYEVNSKSQSEGYWISPSLKDLLSYSYEKLSKVQNLSIGRKDHGKIDFIDTVDLSSIRNLSNILGNIVIFDNNSVCVYPDENEKAPVGTALNVPAIVTLENIFVKQNIGGKLEKITDPTSPKIQVLRSTIEKRGGEFVTYDAEHGVFVFKVAHFSTWGFNDEDLVYDEEMTLEDDIMEDNNSELEISVEGEDDKEILSVKNDNFEDENLVHKPNFFSSSDRKMSDQDAAIMHTEIDIPIEYESKFTNWLDYLNKEGEFGSVFGTAKTSAFESSNLDEIIFGGPQQFYSGSSSIAYKKAEAVLRLPPLFSNHSYATFVDESKLLIRNNSSVSGFSTVSNPVSISQRLITSEISLLTFFFFFH